MGAIFGCQTAGRQHIVALARCSDRYRAAGMVDNQGVFVTHNMAQARRASNECIFMLLGKVVEHAETAGMFVTPAKKETADYIEGRYG